MVLRFNGTLPNISKIVRNNWLILKIDPEFGNVFLNKPTTVFKKSKNIQGLICGHFIKDEKVAKKQL